MKTINLRDYYTESELKAVVSPELPLGEHKVKITDVVYALDVSKEGELRAVVKVHLSCNEKSIGNVVKYYLPLGSDETKKENGRNMLLRKIAEITEKEASIEMYDTVEGYKTHGFIGSEALLVVSFDKTTGYPENKLFSLKKRQNNSDSADVSKIKEMIATMSTQNKK